MSRLPRARAWIITSFAPRFCAAGEAEAQQAVEESYGQGVHLRYFIGQIEECHESKRRHLQAFLYFVNAVSIISVRDVLSDEKVHGEICKDVPGSIKYCSKEDTRIYGPWELGDKPTPGKMSALKVLAEGIRDNPKGFEGLCLENPDVFVRYSRGLSSLRDMAESKEHRRSIDDGGRWPIRIVMLTGKTGIGKSVYAQAHWPEAYWYPYFNNHFWEGYNNEEVVIFDDYEGQLPYRTLLRILSQVPERVNIKMRSAMLRAKTFVFTSNKDWKDWYPGLTGEELEALERRVTKYGEFKSEEEIIKFCKEYLETD